MCLLRELICLAFPYVCVCVCVCVCVLSVQNRNVKSTSNLPLSSVYLLAFASFFIIRIALYVRPSLHGEIATAHVA